MAAEEAQQYTLEWDAKPLGFSIVMDTTGRNAYVSSIQKQENLKKGLKLAAQIVKINNQNAKGLKHAAILDLIKGATLPMRLTFQPRSFASNNTSTESAEEELPKFLLFGGAGEDNNRVNGLFCLVAGEVHNDRSMWQRRDTEDDPVILWFWPKKVSKLPEDLWMIGRRTEIDKQGAYACCKSSATNPLNAHKEPWKVFDKTKNKFVNCELHIAAKVTGEETMMN